MIKQREFDPKTEVEIYYISIHFDDVIQSLTETIQVLYNVVNNEHNHFFSQSSDFTDSLQDEINLGKLRVLVQSQTETLKFSLSLMDKFKLGFKESDPCFFLLGYKFEAILDNRYKYINANPYSFAQAIGNPAKYDVYRALLNKSPMSRFEMERMLHLSRAALDHNLKAMRDAGLLIIDHQDGLTNYYRLDFDFIKTVADHMLETINSR